MWFSFSTNILVFVTAVLLYAAYRKSEVSAYYHAFVLLTGFSSLMAAFGHLELVEAHIASKLLFMSRLLNFVGVFAFMSGTLQFFGYLQHTGYKGLSIAIFFGFVYWLVIYNVFTPVIIYSILSLLLVGVTSYLLNYKEYTAAAVRVIVGVGILVVAAVIFTLYKSDENMIAADIGHFLIATALIVLMTGFNKLTKNEI